MNQIDDQRRVEALKSYEILDTLPESDYDDLTRIAALICDTPISLVSLVDEHRQFLKSHHGVDITETPREIAFCSHAIQRPDEIFIVPDTRTDERFANNPLVLGDPHVLFYAGMPLVTTGGFALGTICVIDRKPRNISAEQVTALKSLANQIVRLLELRKANHELSKAKSQLASYAAQMESFAYMASHDLKEPARNIQQLIRYVLKNIQTADGDTDSIRKYLELALQSASNMNELIEELMTYARSENISQQRDIVELDKILKEIKSLYKGILHEKGGEIIIGDIPNALGSATALKILFQNIIGNGIKYQAPGNAPVIRISGRKEADYIVYEVADNGIGIEKNEWESIFQPFKRLHSRSEYPGTGIGLATCKKIIDQHNGDISLTSEPGKGTTFLVKLPLN